jgi:hypothetical protein
MMTSLTRFPALDKKGLNLAHQILDDIEKVQS